MRDDEAAAFEAMLAEAAAELPEQAPAAASPDVAPTTPEDKPSVVEDNPWGDLDAFDPGALQAALEQDPELSDVDVALLDELLDPAAYLN